MVSRKAMAALLVVHVAAMLASQTEAFVPFFTYSELQRMQVPVGHPAEFSCGNWNEDELQAAGKVLVHRGRAAERGAAVHPERDQVMPTPGRRRTN
ncbi:Promotilin [Manis javanica]|nr:Promotilin [Manis javanica]